MVVSNAVRLRNISISKLDGFQIMRRSRNFILPLLSCVGLSFIFVCIWFMRLGFVRLVSYMIKMSYTYLV